MPILKQEHDLIFSLESKFEGIYLAPIALNLLDKMTTNWDDYDEVYHAGRLIHKVLQNQTMQMDFHLLKKSGEHVGIVLMTTGKIDTDLFFNNAIAIAANEKPVVLNYFHIAPAGRGNGKKWLVDLLMPHYKSLGCTAIYLKSSHPKAFSLYRALGTEIGAYQSISDNHLHSRAGKIFKIVL